MIRVLLPCGIYSEVRLNLVERQICALSQKFFPEVMKYVPEWISVVHGDKYLEGFLENEKRLEAVSQRLTDDPKVIRVWTEDQVETYVIEDLDKVL